ncbi:MAG: hypothetical protein JJE09_12000 [Bacteroidia bacterium]|nr:hypothetical protein [Bacteroidia bacterium]
MYPTFIRSGLFCFLFLLFSSAFSQEDEFNLKNASDYNNFIMKEMAEAVQKNLEYISLSVHSDEFELLESKRREVTQQIFQSKEKISNMPPLDGDTRLRDEAVETLAEYQHAFELDYKDVIGLKRKSKDSFEAMEAYWKAEDIAERKVNKATNRLRKAQQVYANKHNMKVLDSVGDDDLEKKMSKISAVNKYWREIYLGFFKVSKEYDLLWQVLSNGVLGPVDHQRKQVSKVAGAVLPFLKSKPGFNGDVEFRDQTINLLEYYQQVANIDFEKIVEVLGKKPTQEEIDLVNSIINKCNSDHERLVYNWNIASQDLFQKNVDKE